MRIKLVLVFFIFCIQHQIPFAQTEGDTWVLGYFGFGNENYSIMHLNFSNLKLEIEYYFDETMLIEGTASSICDNHGEALIWTNGMQIYGKRGVYIADSIAFDGPNGYWDDWHFTSYGPIGFPVHSGALILPYGIEGNEYSIIYHSSEPHPFGYNQVTKFMEARVKVSADTTFTLVFQDSLIWEHHYWFTGTISATRHANGRDWWMIAFEENSPKYYAFLLDPTGIKLDHEGLVDTIVKEGLGQATFSSKGNYLARMDAITFAEGQYITLYSFDRCSGNLERLKTFHTETGNYTGVAFSPSEQYLYADAKAHLWQWDLWASDIAASQTLVDTFDGFVQPGWFGTYFGPMMEAPDGRIYIVPPSGSSEFMHVIDRPDLPADQCRFKQHFIDLTKPNGRSAPNIPNFRLGPLEHSPCDTIGLNNHPVARWRYEEDQPGLWKTIRFTDLSFFDPQTWHWDFDNGHTSEESSPVHTFDPGLYQVCLTVSNSFGSDSTCRWVEILTTGIEFPSSELPDLYIIPNPFTDELRIQSRSGDFRTAYIRLYDMHGRLAFERFDLTIPSGLLLSKLAPGMYLCMIEDQNGKVYQFKTMKI